MQKVIVTYADSYFEKAAVRLIHEAENIGFFQQCFAYKRSDLSEAVLSSPLLKSQKGGGYWSWKPSIILKTFECLSEGDIIVYVDAGCQLYRHKEWEKYFRILTSYDSIYFNLYSPIKKWIKKDTLDYFRNRYIFNEQWLDEYLFAGGVFFIKKTAANIKLMEQWHSIMFTHPELVTDIIPGNQSKELPCFIEHRHDQAILSLLLYNYRDIFNVKSLWENFEIQAPRRQAIFAARNNGDKAIKLETQKTISYIYWHKFRLPLISLNKQLRKKYADKR